jgi:hypothetical protein
MGLSTRHYLFADDGLYRMSNRVNSGLVGGEFLLPQHAGTKQRVAIVVLQNEGRKPAKISEVEGRYYSFDADGNAAEAFHRDVTNLPLSAGVHLLGLDTDKDSTVVDIGSEVRRERFMREHGWELTKHDLDRIVADIWKKPIVAEKVKDVKVLSLKADGQDGQDLITVKKFEVPTASASA